MDEINRNSIAARLAGQGVQPTEERLASTVPTDLAGAADDNVLRHILPGQHLVRVPVDRLVPAPEGQARQDFNEERLQALAESLKRSGVREPIIVTPHGAEPGRFQIVAGERRWRAAKLAGLAEIPCIVDPGLVERRDKLLAQAEENVHRENLNAVEEAAVLAQLMEAHGIDVREAGELLGKSQRQARRMLQLHTAAPPIKRAVARGLLDPRTALEIVRVHNRFVREDPSPSGAAALKKTERLIERYVSEGWSMRKLERYAAKLEAATSGEEPSNEELEEREEPRPEVKARDTPSRAKPVAAESSMASPGVVVEKKDGRLVVDVGRIERHEISPEERASLIALFEDLLFKTRRS